MFFAISTQAEEEGINQTQEGFRSIETQVAKLIQNMTIEEKVGQLLILGFAGTEFDGSLKRVMDQFRPGSIIVFGRNIKNFYQISALNRDAQRYSLNRFKIPLLIMVDQEGGSVARIKTNPPMPSPLALGASNEAELARSTGFNVGAMLRRLGFNVNLAPVFDLAPKSGKSFIGNRAFSSDPEKVKTFAQLFSDGLSSAKIMPTAKHFPGHGGLIEDSHKKTPYKLMTLDELSSTDLAAFKDYFRMQTPSAVMAAHISYPNIDGSGMPAAFSRVLITDILRNKLGYKGLVITDDIEMLGADKAGSIGERAILAVEAGCDMIMVAWSPHQQTRVYNALLSAVRSSRITEFRINESLTRILTVKFALGGEADPVPPDEFRRAMAKNLNEVRDISLKVSQSNFNRSVGAYSHLKGSIGSDQLIIVFSSDHDFKNQIDREVDNPLRWLRLNPKNLSRAANVANKYPDALNVYYVSGLATGRNASALPRVVKQRTIVINSTYPGAIIGRDDFKAVIDVNGLDPRSGQWLAQWFFRKAEDSSDSLRYPAQEPLTHEIGPSQNINNP